MDELNNYTEEDDAVAKFLPGGFGKRSVEADVAAQIARTKREQVAKNTTSPKPKKGDSDEEEDSDDGSDDDDDEFPVSHELVLKTHERPITTFDLDISGSRLISGSADCTLKLHDFASMTPTTLKAFKSVDPSASKTSSNAETHPIYHVEFCPLAPSLVLVVSATTQAKIFTRDGEPMTEFVKGDMYLRDMNNTKGHVSELTTGTWHPSDKNLCLTAGTDSTLRIWDVNIKRTQKEVIVYKSKAPGSAGRTRITTVRWGSPAQGGPGILVGAALDGSLVMWSGSGSFARPAGEIQKAHEPGSWTGGLDISKDGRTIVTRGGDDTIKLWDTRKFKQPISVVEHLSTSGQYQTSNIRFSPNSASILTGSQTGDLHILNPATLRPELVTPVTPGSPLITVSWHEKLNQIITGSENAEIHVLYNPTTSSRGAVAVMSKVPKRRHIDDDPSRTTDTAEGISGDSIVNPNGLLGNKTNLKNSSTGLTMSGKSKDPRRPHLPAATPFAKSQPDAQHIKNHIPLSSMRDEDPREALLKYAEKAEKDPMFTKAWKATQPKTIYAELSEEEEEEQPSMKRAKLE